MTAPFHAITEAYTAAQAIGILPDAGGRVHAAARADLLRQPGRSSGGDRLHDQKVSSFLSYIGQDLYEDPPPVSAQRLKSLIDSAVVRREDTQLLSESVESCAGWTK